MAVIKSIRYDTIGPTVYLTCSKMLTDSQLNLPHGMNKKCKRKIAKSKLMSVISPVQSHDHEGRPVHIAYGLITRVTNFVNSSDLV